GSFADSTPAAVTNIPTSIMITLFFMTSPLLWTMSVSSFLDLKNLALFEDSIFVVHFPRTHLLAVVVGALVPELPVVVVAFPQTNLFAANERPCLKGLAVLAPPFPVAVQFAVQVLAHGLELAVSVAKLPLTLTLAIPKSTFAGEFAPR